MPMRILALLLLLSPAALAAEPASVEVPTTAIRRQILSEKAVRGVHLSAWGSGSRKLRRELIARINNSVINGVVVAIKEVDGKVYIPGVEKAHKYGAYAPAIAKPEEMMQDFKQAGLYTVARIVVFKDKVLPLARKDLAVRTPALATAGKALLVGFLCYGLSITFYITAAQKLGAVRSQLIFSIAPLFGVLLAVLALSESLSGAQILSGALLFISVWLMLAEKHAHAHEHQEAEHTHQHDHADLHHDHHGGAPEKPHAHLHRHAAASHAHPHWPDLHHRHSH